MSAAAVFRVLRSLKEAAAPDDRGSPTDFAPNQVIKGWTEAMQLMVEGDKWEMYIPSELGYGDGGSPPKIKGGDVLVFVMEIIKINGDKVDAIKCDPETKENCNEKESAYIDKMKKKFAGNVDGIKGELKRLEGMSSAKVKPELQQWMSRRCALCPLLRPPPALSHPRVRPGQEEDPVAARGQGAIAALRLAHRDAQRPGLCASRMKPRT